MQESVGYHCVFPAQQTVMFSETWPVTVHQLAKEFMDPNIIKVVVGLQDLAANHDVMQIVEVLEDWTETCYWYPCLRNTISLEGTVYLSLCYIRKKK